MVLFRRLRLMGTRLVRSLSSSPATSSPGYGDVTAAYARFLTFCKKTIAVPVPAFFFGAFACNNLVQDYLGSKENFFYGSFVTDKSPEDIAEFYQAEDLLKIIAIHPFFFKLFMDKVVVGEAPASEEEAHLSVDESRMIVRNLGMEASFEIIEHEEEIDGVTQKVSFKRHERFLDYFPFIADWGYKVLLWDQTWTYGFRRLESGSIEVYHSGERFYGPWPIRIIVFFHQNYVLWACRRYITSDAFGSEEDDAMDRREEQLACMPLDAFKGLVQKLKREKQQILETQMNDPMAKDHEVAETKEILKKLSVMETYEESPISVVKRPVLGSRQAPQEEGSAKKLVAGDAETREVLEATMKVSKVNKAVNSAVKEALQNPDLEFKKREKGKAQSVHKLIRQQSQMGHYAGWQSYKN